MPRYYRNFEPGQLQFITSSTYRRVAVFTGQRFWEMFAEVLDGLRRQFGFRLAGWVLMPDHFHLLIQPRGADLKGKVCAIRREDRQPGTRDIIYIESDEHRMTTLKNVYRECVSEIDSIVTLFDTSGRTARCLDVTLAQRRMADLKSRWRERIQEAKGTEIESVVSEALTRIEVRSNSNPNQKWLEDLHSARLDLDFYVSH